MRLRGVAGEAGTTTMWLRVAIGIVVKAQGWLWLRVGMGIVAEAQGYVAEGGSRHCKWGWEWPLWVVAARLRLKGVAGEASRHPCQSLKHVVLRLRVGTAAEAEGVVVEPVLATAHAQVCLQGWALPAEAKDCDRGSGALGLCACGTCDEALALSGFVIDPCGQLCLWCMPRRSLSPANVFAIGGVCARVSLAEAIMPKD